MYAVNEEIGSIFVSEASLMLELGLLQRYMRALCLLRTPTAERWMLLCSKSVLKTKSWAGYRRGMSPSRRMRRFIKKKACKTLQRNTRSTWFFCRRIHQNTILLNIRGVLWSEKLQAMFIFMAPLHKLWIQLAINDINGKIVKFYPSAAKCVSGVAKEIQLTLHNGELQRHAHIIYENVDICGTFFS